MDRGYICLYRKTLESQVFQNESLWRLWSWCLLKATHKKIWVSFKTGKGQIEIEVQPGTFIFGRHSAAKELKENDSTIWKRLQKLKSMGNCNIESNRQYSIISIINWDTYQSTKKESNIESNRQVTGKEQASNTNNNNNNVNNDNKEGQKICDFPESENTPPPPAKEKKVRKTKTDTGTFLELTELPESWKTWAWEETKWPDSYINTTWVEFRDYRTSPDTPMKHRKKIDWYGAWRQRIRQKIAWGHKPPETGSGIKPNSVRDALILDRQLSRRALNELDRQRSERANGEATPSLPSGWPDD